MVSRDLHASYITSYLERDVRQLSHIADLLPFQRFMRMMDVRCGQLLNLNTVAHGLGVAQTTPRDWLTILEASYVVFRQATDHTNFGKRLVKTPKLDFHDTGLAAWLLGNTDAQTMDVHPMRGALFENLYIAEHGKHLRHSGAAGAPYLWRDNICSRWSSSPAPLSSRLAGNACTPVSATRHRPARPRRWSAARPATSGRRARAWRSGAIRCACCRQF